MSNCKNCNTPVTEKFCPVCGKAVQLKRIDKHYISHEILHLLHFEKGFFYSAKELIIRPGDTIREFIKDDRSKHMKPVAFLILTSLLFTLIAHFFHVDEIYNERDRLVFEKSSIGTIMHWVQTHYGYANIAMGAFIALGVTLFFRKYKYNFFEISVLLCFVMGQAMLLLTIETLFSKILSEQSYRIILGIISLAYPTWAIGQFFDKKKIINYVKAFFAYLAGYLLFNLSIVIIGLVTDVFLKIFGKH